MFLNDTSECLGDFIFFHFFAPIVPKHQDIDKICNVVFSVIIALKGPMLLKMWSSHQKQYLILKVVLKLNELIPITAI